jgi:hypothetical protein
VAAVAGGMAMDSRSIMTTTGKANNSGFSGHLFNRGSIMSLRSVCSNRNDIHLPSANAESGSSAMKPLITSIDGEPRFRGKTPAGAGDSRRQRHCKTRCSEKFRLVKKY